MNQPIRRRQDEDHEDPLQKLQKLNLEAQKPVECEVPASRVKMDDLPDLAIATILSFLSITELTEVIPKVCKKWRKAAQDPIVWLDKEYDVWSNNSDDEVLTTLRRVPQLRSLSMFRPVNYAIVNTLCENCTHLTSLYIAQSLRISYSLLNKLVICCRNIKSLIIPAQLLTDEVNTIILSHLLQLQSLTLWEYFKDADKSIHLGPLGDGCTNLSELSMMGENHLCMEDVKEFIKGKRRTLTCLTLPWTAIKERWLIPLLKDLTALVNFKLCVWIYSIEELLEASKALSHLKMTNIRSLDLDFLGDKAAVGFKFSGLFYLQVLKINQLCLQNSFFVALCEGSQNLKELHLYRCTGLDDGDLKELHCLKKLETLAIGSCDGLRGAALEHMAQVPNLRKLLLAGCDFKKLKSGVPFILHIHTLETLSFRSIKYICNFQFDQIPQMLTNLRVLTVEGCELDPRIPGQLMQQMPRLRVYVPDSDD